MKLVTGRVKCDVGEPTFSEQDFLVGWEFALNGELKQVVTGPTDRLFVLLVPSEPSQLPELGPRP